MNKPTKTILILIVILIAGSLGYVFWSSRSTSNGQNITNQPLTQPEQQKNQEPDSQGVEVITPDVDTSDWVEYTNTALGYKVKLPPSLRVYSEAYNEPISLDENNRFLILHGRNKKSISVWIYEGDYDKILDNKHQMKVIKFDNNIFKMYSFNKNDIYGENYIIENKRNNIIIFITFIKEDEKADFYYIRNGILSSFEFF